MIKGAEIETEIETGTNSRHTRRKPRFGGRTRMRITATILANTTLLLVCVAVMTVVVDGWVLPPLYPLKRQHKHNTLSQHQPRKRRANNACVRRANNPLALVPTDEDGEISTGKASISETKRKELVDAIFKGSSSSSATTTSRQLNEEEEDDDVSPLLDKFDGFLDKPFFDPNDYDEMDDSFFGKIAAFIRADYELFEAIFVACFFLLLITVAKDLLRAQMMATGAVSSGKLF